jgi:HEAT repeat protein
MKALLAISLSLGVAASAAFATGSVATLSEHVKNTLTSIDTIPTRIQLDDAFDGAALPSLSSIAQDKDIDIGVRVRAIHGLGKYCPEPCDPATDLAHQSLTQLIGTTRIETVGEPVILLRAAIETIGALKVKDDAPLLTPLLDHASRDIRAATARALRDLCNDYAITPLRIRYTAETTDQVKLAISEALRILGQCGG